MNHNWVLQGGVVRIGYFEKGFEVAPPHNSPQPNVHFYVCLPHPYSICLLIGKTTWAISIRGQIYAGMSDELAG